MSNQSDKLQALVIDDNMINREVAVELLSSHDIEADQADEGMTGLSMLRKKPYDLVLLDINMPGLDGNTVCQVIRDDSETRHRYVVAYTAHAYAADQEKMLAAGFDALLIKPISFESLTRAIEPILLAHGCAG